MILKIFLNSLSPKHINSIVIIFLRNCTYLFFITDVSKVVGQNDNLKIKITQNNTPHFSYMHNNFFLKKSVLYLKSMLLTTEFPPAETTLAEPSGCRYVIIVLTPDLRMSKSLSIPTLEVGQNLQDLTRNKMFRNQVK